MMAVFSAGLANLPAFAMDTGITQTRAASLVTLLAAGGLIGKLIFGYASDKVSLKVALWVSQLLVAMAMLVYLQSPGWLGMCIASALFGLASGGLLPVWGAMVAILFGPQHAGRVMGFMGPLITLTVMPSFPLAGFIYDQTGAYTLCFVMFIILTILSAALIAPLRLGESASSQ